MSKDDHVPGSVAQLAECSNGKREALGWNPGRATIFSSPVTFIVASVGKRFHYQFSRKHVAGLAIESGTTDLSGRRATLNYKCIKRTI